jgi:hypothetical protein
MTRPSAALNRQRAQELVSQFSGLSILVAGDVMLDRFIVGRVTRISPEAPVPVVQFHAEHYRLGGAGNVAHNIAALGGRATLIGVIGTDLAAERLIDQLNTAGIASDGLVRDPGRPTTEKVRVVTERNQQVVRIDYERDAEIRDGVESGVIERVTVLGSGMKGGTGVGLSEGLHHTIGRSDVAEHRRAAARGSQNTAPRMLCRRDAGDAEQSRGRSRNPHAHPQRRRSARGRARVSLSRTVRVSIDHARRTWDVALG